MASIETAIDHTQSLNPVVGQLKSSSQSELAHLADTLLKPFASPKWEKNYFSGQSNPSVPMLKVSRYPLANLLFQGLFWLLSPKVSISPKKPPYQPTLSRLPWAKFLGTSLHHYPSKRSHCEHYKPFISVSTRLEISSKLLEILSSRCQLFGRIRLRHPRWSGWVD